MLVMYFVKPLIRFQIYKSVNDVLMQAKSCKDLELLVSTFFIFCEEKNVKISYKKFQLSTNMTFGGVNLDASTDNTIFGVSAKFHCWSPNISKFS